MKAGTATGLFSDTVHGLTAPPEAVRERLKAVDPSAALHRGAMLGLSCMSTVEVSSARHTPSPLSFPLTIAAWNLERCYFPDESAALLRDTGAGVVLLSEMDRGMSRTGQRDTACEIAGQLSMNHIYGVEFLELDLGSSKERHLCSDSFNAQGFHGNALLARSVLTAPFLVRLDDHGHWLVNSPEPRIGGRCAVGARIETAEGPILAVSVHLESRADGPGRAAQMALLFDCLDRVDATLPLIIGGDLNTGLQNKGDFDSEPLFAMAAGRGFTRHGGPLDEPTTRPSRITKPGRAYKLDWFLTRGITVSESAIIPALTPDGKPLSDHELITLTVVGLNG